MAGIAVIRVSGPDAFAAARSLTGRLPRPRQAARRVLRHPKTKDVLDDGLLLTFPGPNSFTGEDVAEFHLHGSLAVIRAVLDVLGGMTGLRPAERGEFTKRAFLNGKMDLAQAEAVADLVAARTACGASLAAEQLDGGLSRCLTAIRQQVIRIKAHLEVQIDFSDEDDVPEGLMTRALELIGPLAEEIGQAAGGGRGERLREGLRVAIAGPPNVGKSTLFNRFARREAAIVSPFPGTTRDVLEVHLDLGGYPVAMLDTAGIREASDPVECEGVRRASEQADASDLVLWVVDATERKAATLALSACPDAKAKELLGQVPDLAAAVAHGALSWDNLGQTS